MRLRLPRTRNTTPAPSNIAVVGSGTPLVVVGVKVNVTVALAVKRSELPEESVAVLLAPGFTKIPNEVGVLIGMTKGVSYGANTVVSITGPFVPLPAGLEILLKVTVAPGATFVAVGEIKVKPNNGFVKVNPAKADAIEELERNSPNSLLFCVALSFFI